jgi:hypothetical protein
VTWWCLESPLEKGWSQSRRRLFQTPCSQYVSTSLLSMALFLPLSNLEEVADR